jgi:hypothetical protein
MTEINQGIKMEAFVEKVFAYCGTLESEYNSLKNNICGE